ncbi:hypothetical protein [Streptomyces vastus]|uniref:Lipoprotein n=1 Tax=Streptomyces vastus TaxID=285451 RepID=A0ABN3RL73_9ACTN
MTLWTKGAGAAVMLLAVAGCTVDGTGSAGPDEPAGSSASSGSGESAGGAALAAVDSLAVKGRAPRTGYDRDRFGSPWADTDSNGCGTRVISMLRRMTEVFVQLIQGGVACAY